MEKENLTGRIPLPGDKKGNLDLSVYLMNLRFFKWSTTEDGNPKDFILDTREIPIWECTIQLQQFWKKKHRTKDEIKKIHHENIFKNVFLVAKEILEGSLPVKRIKKEEILRKIVIFITMFAGLGNPMQSSVIEKNRGALTSIFKNSEMENFLNLSKSAKEKQLIELARLVTGIRLFEMDWKKAVGEEIEDVPSILARSLKAIKERVDSYKAEVDERVDHLVKILSLIYGIGDATSGEFPPDSGMNQQAEELKSLLAYYRQIDFCLKEVMEDLEDSLLTIEELVKKFQSSLLLTGRVLKGTEVIPTNLIFPRFLELSEIWVRMREEVDVLGEINNNFVDLSSSAKLMDLTPLKLNFNIGTESPRPSSGVNDIVYDSEEFHSGVKICPFSELPDEHQLRYRGFCAWTLAHTEGVLLTGNISTGILLFENRSYSFSTPEAALKWARDPKYCVDKVLHLVRNKPGLKELLNLTPNEVEESEAGGKNSTTKEGEERKGARENAGVQTELHPIESHIRKDYTFSEWELGRRALKLANLTRCSTKSQQTTIQNRFLPEVGIQVTSGLDKETQTRRDSSCDHMDRWKFDWDSIWQ